MLNLSTGEFKKSPFIIMKSLTLPSLLFLFLLLPHISTAIETQDTLLADSGSTKNEELQPSTTTVTTPDCALSCEACGVNSERCLFNPAKCSIKCECKPEFSGDRCAESSNKITAWRTILDQLATQHMAQQLAESALLATRNLFALIASQQNALDPYDVAQLAQTLSHLVNASRATFHMDETMLEHMLVSIDYLLISNYNNFKAYNSTSGSLLAQANWDYENASLNLLKAVDKLTSRRVQLLPSASSFYRLKLKNFETLVLDLNDPGKLDLSKNSNLSPSLKADSSSSPLLIDSISLNERILKKRYNRDKIKVALKIYFNFNRDTG
jgi:hypothetical protein